MSAPGHTAVGPTRLSFGNIGQVLDGKWQILERLGEGAMGSVYLASDIALGRKVAVKVLANRYAAEPDAVARFQREGQVMAQLDHPNLVPVHAVAQHDALPFIVMKYVEGETLQGLVRGRGGQLDPGEAIDLALQLLAGLQHLHDAGLVHRDVKPSNIVVDAEGRLTLLDFGIARPQRGQGLTQVGMPVGTPLYMSPEQAVGSRADHRADLYAVGVVLYELLTGEPPFRAENELSLLRAHVETPPPWVAARAPGVSDALSRVVARAMAKLPDERYQSAALLAEALDDASAEVVPSRVEVASTLRARRGGSAGAWVFTALMALVLGAAVGAAGYLLWGLHRAQHPLPPPPLSARPAPPVAPEAAEPEPVPEPAVVPEPALIPEPQAPLEPAKTSPTRRHAVRAVPSAAGELTVTAALDGRRQWAWLEVDGLRRGTTPRSLTLPAGSHQVKVYRAELGAAEAEVVVVSDKSLSLQLELVP